MPYEHITPDDVRRELVYLKDLGVMKWRHARSGVPEHSNAGSVHASTGRWRIMVRGRLYFRSRLAWAYVHGVWPTGEIDHINGKHGDDRIINLRDISPKHNAQNRTRPNKNNTQKLLGVYENKRNGRFIACITIDGKNKHLGMFDTPEAAHQAYLLAKWALHPGST